MADLENDTYTMADLEETYDHFISPDFCIKIDGTDVKQSLELFIDNLKLILSMDAAGSCSFEILNAYDLEAAAFRDDVKTTFMIGKLITAEIGYAGHLTELFKGYIQSIQIEYSDTPVYSVTCMDVIRLMQETDTLGRSYNDKNPTAIFKEVMEKYNGICPESSIKAAISSSPNETITQKDNDYNFVKELCLIEGCDFFVLDGTAYFLKSDRTQSSMITLEGSKHLLSYSNEHSYLDKSIQIVKVNKDKTLESILCKVDICGDNQRKVLSKPQIKNASLEAEGDEESAKRQAKKAALDEYKNSISSSGVSIGIPQIVPGRALTIANIDESINDDYEVIKVEHSISSDGFTTTFELGGKLDGVL